MKCHFLLVVATLFVSLPMGAPVHAQAKGDEITVASTDWAWWRGPNRNGIAAANQTPPLKWEEENILWKTPVPGRGHGSPTVVGDRIFLATADEEQEIQSVICYDRTTGKQRWKTDIHKGGFTLKDRQGHIRSSKASSTVACDGKRVFINFINADVVYLTALDLDGKKLWQKKVTDYVTHQGYGSSVSLYGPLVIIAADHKTGGILAGYDRVTGDQVWSLKRPAQPNYASPIILNVDGRDQIFLSGGNIIASYDPLTGKVNWEVEGATTECVTSTVTDGENIVTSGGYPLSHISVVKADGSGKMLWSNKNRVYIPSMLVKNGYLYVVNDAGMAFCYVMKTGEVLWEHKIGGKYTASPVLVGEHIFAISDRGVTTIFKASPKAFELVSTNTLDYNVVQATPVFCGSQVYMRVANKSKGQRQEMLYCLAQRN